MKKILLTESEKKAIISEREKAIISNFWVKLITSFGSIILYTLSILMNPVSLSNPKILKASFYNLTYSNNQKAIEAINQLFQDD